MSSKYDFDVVVIGGGPGGYVSAIRASQLGLKAAVIEKDKLGGVCLNIGCIPSKALIHQAELVRSVSDLESIGVKVDVSGLDYSKVYAKSRKAADSLSKGVQYLFKKNNIEVIFGEAKIISNYEVSVNGEKTVTASNIIIATGSSPKEIPGFEFDEEMILSSTGILNLQKLPKSILVLGSGPIGIEFAHVMNAFGVEVHVVELLDRILPLEDDEAVEVLRKSFLKRGVKFYTSSKASLIKKGDGFVDVLVENAINGVKIQLKVDKVLVAVGRTPNTSTIGLENVGIAVQRGFIPVGAYCQTLVSNIYAIGDVVESPLLAHVASKEGEIAAERIAGKECQSGICPNSIPGAVYCEPQLASFGYTERKAKDKNISFAKAVFPYRGAGKSVAIEKTEGLVKILYKPDTKEVIGAHIVGAEATELIHEILLAKSSELLPEDIAGMIHAHPTLSESVMEAARIVEGWAVHV